MRNREFRFIITNKCNYNCFFCHNEGIEKTKKVDNLTPEDYLFVYQFGVKKYNSHSVTISGGEPLLSKNYDKIVKCLSAAGAKVVTVTNGSLLHESESKDSVFRFNVSVHTLNNNEYNNIIQVKKDVNSVLSNMKTVSSEKIRVNFTALQSNVKNTGGLKDLIDYCSEMAYDVKITELSPITNSEFIPINEIGDFLEHYGYRKLEVINRKHIYTNDVHKVYVFQIFCNREADGINEKITTCIQSNDIYITNDGKMYGCRKLTQNVDLNEAIKTRDEKLLEKKISQFFDLNRKQMERVCINL